MSCKGVTESLQSDYAIVAKLLQAYAIRRHINTIKRQDLRDLGITLSAALAFQGLKNRGLALEGGHHLIGEDAELVLEDLQRHPHDRADVDALDAGVALFGLLEAFHIAENALTPTLSFSLRGGADVARQFEYPLS